LKKFIAVLITTIIFSSITTTGVSAQTLIIKKMENSKPSYNKIEISSGYNKLVYYNKKIVQIDRQISILESQLSRIAKGTKEYGQNLQKQIKLLKERHYWLKKIVVLLDNKEITDEQYFEIRGY